MDAGEAGEGSMKTKKPVFIVFEGLDGSGKSTSAKDLARRLDARFMTTPSPVVREFRDELIASFDGCQEACQLFYLATLFSAAEEIKRLLAGGTSVVLDRYFLSTQAYAAFRGSRLHMDSLSSLLPPADLTVFLDVPLSLRQERLKTRATSLADRETLSIEADVRLREEHRKRAELDVVGRLLWLRCEEMSREEILEFILGSFSQVRRTGEPNLTTDKDLFLLNSVEK